MLRNILMHRLIIDVTRARLIQSANRESTRRNPVGLLLVTNKVLDGSNDMLLHGNDRLVEQSASKVRIVGETLPIAASTNNSSKASANRSESDVGALALKFGSKVFFRLVDEGFVPGGTEVETGWVAVDAIGVADAVAVVDEA